MDFSALKNYQSPQQLDPRQAMSNQMTEEKKKKPWWSSWISELAGTGGALGGAAAGATAGSVVPGIGTVIGGLAGAALGGFAGGTGGRLAENKIRDDRWDVGSALKEGAITGILSPGPIKSAKVLSAGSKALLAGGGRLAVKEAAEKAATTSLLKKMAASTSGKAANSMLKATPSTFEKASDAGFNLTELAGKWLPKLGKNYDEILGKAGTKSGTLNNTLGALENGISNVTKQAGRTVRLSGDDVIKNLKAELKILKPKLGSTNQVKQLEGLIEEATKKYKNGIPIGQARELLKNANREFGRSIVDNTGDAVIKSAQKVEANALRSSLKGLFPAIGDALDSQSELITLREVLSRAAAASRKGGLGDNIPFSILGIPKKVVGSQAVAGRIASKGGGGLLNTMNSVTGIPTKGIAGRSLLGGMLSNNGSPDPSSMIQPSVDQGGFSQVNQTQQQTPQDLLGFGGGDTGFSSTDPLGLNPAQSGPTVESLRQALQEDYINTGGENAEALMQLAELYGIGGQQEPLNSTSAAVVTDLENGIVNIRDLGAQFEQSGANNPIIGWLRGKNPVDTEAQSLQANIARVKQVIGKALEGGVLRKEDEIKYAKILPKLTDTDAVAQNKIAYIADDLERKLSFYRNNLGGGGGGLDIQSLNNAQLSY